MKKFLFSCLLLCAFALPAQAQVVVSSDNRTVGPIRSDSAFRVVDTTGPTRNLTVNGITATNVNRDCIRLRDAERVVIRNVSCSFRRMPQLAPNLPEGIAIYAGSGLIEDVTVSGFRMTDLAYPNGDGIATELPVHDLTIRRARAVNNSDSGFDLKGGPIALVDSTAEDNTRCAKIWGRTHMQGSFRCVRPWTTAVELGAGGDLTIDHLVVDLTRALRMPPNIFFVSDRATRLTVMRCTFIGLPATGRPRLLVRDNNARNRVPVTLGAGCQL